MFHLDSSRSHTKKASIPGVGRRRCDKVTEGYRKHGYAGYFVTLRPVRARLSLRRSRSGKPAHRHFSLIPISPKGKANRRCKLRLAFCVEPQAGRMCYGLWQAQVLASDSRYRATSADSHVPYPALRFAVESDCRSVDLGMDFWPLYRRVRQLTGCFL
jgi:hypothetical protein